MDTLKVQLEHLKSAGVGIQSMGTVHTKARGVLDACDPSMALHRPAGIGLGPSGFLEQWTAYKDALTHMLNSNADSLHDCGQALIWCADALFPRVDDETGARFQRLEQEVSGG